MNKDARSRICDRTGTELKGDKDEQTFRQH